MKKIGVIGLGYVGLIQAFCLAEESYEIIGIDIDKNKIEKLNKKECPIFEKDLDKLVKKHMHKKVHVFNDYNKIKECDIIFICVGTPQKENGETDLTYIFETIKKIKENIKQNDKKTIIIKSTVPVGTCRKIDKMFKNYDNIEIVSNPEFLREGTAIYDFYNSNKVVLGFNEKILDTRKKEILEIYSFLKNKAKFILTNWETSELIKYTSNAFLAMKISFINEISRLCDTTNANVKTISEAIGLDPRIGKMYLNAGIGYGGSCFPKDIKSLIFQFKEKNIYPILIRSIDETNEFQVLWFFNKIKDNVNFTNELNISLFGITFKPNTDDIRESRGIKLIELLSKENINEIRVYDPNEIALKNFKNKFKNMENVKIYNNPYKAVENSDILIVTIEDKNFNNLDWNKIYKNMRKKYIFDGRNILMSKNLKKLGFKYFGVGIN